MAGLRTSLALFQWFAATLPTALIPTLPAWQKNADKPLRTSLLSKLPARSVSTAAHRTTNRCVTALHSTFHLSRGGLTCSLSSPMFPLIGDGDFDGFGRRWGYFQPCSFHTPICTPISLSQGQRSLANGAVCPRAAAMNSEKQERAMSGE